MGNKVTIRLSKADAENIVTIVNALRATSPFVSRTQTLKAALAIAAKQIKEAGSDAGQQPR